MYVIADPSKRVDVGLVVTRVERVDVVCTKVKKKCVFGMISTWLYFCLFSSQHKYPVGRFLNSAD